MRWGSSSAIGLVFTLLFLCKAYAEDDHLGIIEYEIACLPCHGLSGKGNGPQAGLLKTPPSDLTRISQANGGSFPFERVAAVIDGRTVVSAHGQRAMPVWGDRYRVFVEPGESRALVERRAKQRIQALARYIEELQQK